MMSVKRDLDMSAANDECEGSDLKSESSSKRENQSAVLRSTSYKALSERTMKLLAEKVSFPSVSKCRLKQIKVSILASLSDSRDFPDQRALSKEYKIGSYFDAECPIYSQSFPHVPDVELGKQLDMLDLLGDNLLSFNQNIPSFGSSVNVESNFDLKGKFVMICCVFVPSLWCSDDGRMVYHTALASQELAKRDDFVLVVVPMMRSGFTHSRSAYQHFLSGFSCLVVPFDDSLRREYICSALGFDGKLKVVILDPSQTVLYHGPPNMFLEFGGAEHGCIPFTPVRREICLSSNYVLQDLSLAELLGLRHTVVLHNFSKDASITISELIQKFVGIYVCSDCTSLRKVQEVHEECGRQKYELDIVVVCCPFDRQVPPTLHKELVENALKSSKELLGWWFFPFDNTVCHRLRRMCEADSNGEGLFIVDPIEKYVDPYGLPIIRDFGTDCYPFTRRNLVEKEFQRIMGLRLNSLLRPWTYVSASLVTDAHTFDINTALLKNKVVVLYLYKEKEKFLADKLAAWYKKNIKRKHSNVVEVVVVSIDGGGTSDKYFMDKGWLVCRADPSKSAKLCDEYFHPLCGPHEAVVAFGEDGVIQSMNASHLLECQGPPFHGNLREEIGREFDYAGFQYMRHYDYSSFMKKGADIKLDMIQRMEVEKDVDVFTANDGCGGSVLKSESRSLKRPRRRSTSYKALPDRTLKLLAEKASFPNVSVCRLKQLKVSISVSGFRDTFDRPDPQALSKEHKIGSYFDTECPIYSQSLAGVPNVRLGKQLNVLDLIGNKFLSFNREAPRFQHTTKFRRYAGLCDPRRGLKVSCNVRRIQPPKFRSGVEMESTTVDLKGKYVMICCVFVPSMWCSEDGEMVYRTALASHELARRDDFALVVVPMMRKGFTHSFSAYENFLSGFSCLAVPFWDSHRREHICSALGFDGKLKVVILDPSQEVLYNGSPSMFLWFGGGEDDCFPFTPERQMISLARGRVLQDVSLSELLGLSDTDVLCSISKGACITISELKHKLVGIYVCSDCRSMREVQEVDEECRRQKYELEIVVVCCPNWGVPPKLHEEWVMDALTSLKLLGLWFFPFNNTVSQRLSQMHDTYHWEEGLLIVDPVEKNVDPYGLPIICDFGMDCYPFTRRGLVEKEFQRLTGLRLRSLLLPWTHVCRKDEVGIVEVSVEEALLNNNKVVLLYLYAEEEKDLADKLTLLLGEGCDEKKNNTKRKYPNVEVVAVSIDGSGTSEECFMEKGWLVCRADPSKSDKLCDQYFHPQCDTIEAVVAFGEDGLIRSMEACQLLEKSQAPPFLGSNLREEIAREFDEAGFMYMGHYDYSSL